MRNIKQGLRVSGCLLVLGFAGTSIANGNDQSNHGRACFVQFGGTGNGSSANKPYGSLQQVENDSRCKVINVLPGLSPLDGGITLKDGQKLIGSGGNVCANPKQKILPMITNTVNAESLQAGPVIRLANNNTVQNLKVLALSIGVFGDNITGADLNKLVITKAASYPNTAVVDPGLCDLTNAVYRGCQFRGIRKINGAIQLLADDLGGQHYFTYNLKNIIISDIADPQRWADGVYVVAAGNNTKIRVDLSNINVENVGRGFEFIGYNTSKLIGSVVNSSAKNITNDGILVFTSFLLADCPTCPSSDPTGIVNVDRFSATPEPADGNEQQGIEIVAGEPNKGTHEIHVANTSLSGFSIGFFVWNQTGYPKTAIYDLGCLNPNTGTVINRAACVAAGYTSLGKNRIFGNDASAVFDPGWAPGNEILIDGKGDVLAQNNYWGPYSPGRITVLVDGVRRCGEEYDAVGNAIRLVPPYRCTINQGVPTTGVGTINDNFPRH